MRTCNACVATRTYVRVCFECVIKSLATAKCKLTPHRSHSSLCPPCVFTLFELKGRVRAALSARRWTSADFERARFDDWTSTAAPFLQVFTRREPMPTLPRDPAGDSSLFGVFSFSGQALAGLFPLVFFHSRHQHFLSHLSPRAPLPIA